MGVIENALSPVDGHLVSISRNPMKGWYEIEVGVYKSWVFDNNKDIECEIISENEDGKMLKIFPKNNKITIDELVRFVELIIETNERIADREKEFAAEMQKMKEMLEEKAKSFYSELDSLKDSSFKNLSINLEKGFSDKVPLMSTSTPKKGRGRPKKTKTDDKKPVENSGSTTTSGVKIVQTDED